jgi:hypothetical protein
MSVPQDKTPEGAPVLVVGDRELVREEACSYKAVLAAQYISEVIEAIKLGDFLEQLAASQRTDDATARTIVEARDVQQEIEELEEKLEGGQVSERDQDFIETHLQKLKDTRRDMLASVIQDQSQTQTRWWSVVADALPIVFQQAPEFIYKFCALMMIPNADLEKAYRKPNGIKRLIKENRHWLMFGVGPAGPLQIANFFLPAVGFDVLKKEGLVLVETVTELMTEETPLDTSPNSSELSLESESEN